MGKSEIIILIPSFNELQSLKNILPILKLNYDFIVINDCSTDKTKEYLKKKKIKHINNKKQLGYEKTIIRGIKFIISKLKKKKYIITFDADNQHKINDIKKFENLIKKKKIDFLIGQRITFNRKLEKIISIIFKFKFKLQDPLSGFKMYNINLLKKHENTLKEGFYLVDLALLLTQKTKNYKNIIININQRTDKPKIGNSLQVNLKLIKIIFFLIFKKKIS